ncbi:MAG: hypothetical protein LBI57_00485 [Helicobacteraceae bacterium]|jgi:methionyl-tRNA formyltransferase|nr:hypothetical protein [Helicobacteraceae bacterium]
MDNRRATILFLSNSAITKPLFDRLQSDNENIIHFESEITRDLIKNNHIYFIISYNYKTIIQPAIVNLLPRKIINLHISYLPYNRGANPNIWSFIENTPCGVTIHEIDDGIDTGDILAQEKIDYDYEKETLETAYRKSHEKIQKLFYKNWDKIKNNEITSQKQARKGTFHSIRELDRYKDIIDYRDVIKVFLEKVDTKNKSRQK